MVLHHPSLTNFDCEITLFLCGVMYSVTLSQNIPVSSLIAPSKLSAWIQPLWCWTNFDDNSRRNYYPYAIANYFKRLRSFNTLLRSCSACLEFRNLTRAESKTTRHSINCRIPTCIDRCCKNRQNRYLQVQAPVTRRGGIFSALKRHFSTLLNSFWFKNSGSHAFEVIRTRLSSVPYCSIK